jgi:nitrogen fixation/metabolism regulation signal transduction histidine kinase
VSLALRLALGLVMVLAAALMLLLASASSSSSVFDQIYPWLLAANVLITLIMMGVTVWVVIRFWQRMRRGVFGARIMVRLAFAFALIGIIPVALVSFVSAQFLAKTIDSWFTQSVNVALDAGVSLGRTSLDTLRADAMNRARRLAISIEEVPAAQMIGHIEKVIDGREGVDVLILSNSGAVLASRSAQLTSLVPELPPKEALDRARAARQFVSVEPRAGAYDRSLQVRAIAMTTPLTGLVEESRFVQWVEQIPQSLTLNLEALNDGVRDYDQLALGKEGLRKMYGVTLALTLLLAFLGALLSALLLSGWLAGPLRQLERATKAVASGDYRPLRFDPASTDELNVLVGSFNQMTGQLNEARDLAQRSRVRLEESNMFLQQVLAHLSAGVLIFDERWNLREFNASAERILGIRLLEMKDEPFGQMEVLGGCAGQLREGLLAAVDSQFQYEATLPDGGSMTLLVSGSRLPGKQPQYVVVFDDIGELLSAQRSRDFAEIARRLAHEIKNPLTPIQLSAERLERRLADRLGPDDAELLGRSTRTIVEQVTALKAMVDEFRNYARLPAPNPEPVNLAGLLKDMQLLYATDARIQWPDLSRPMRVMADRAQLIQVIHNLIQNAQDAVVDDPNAEILVQLGERVASRGDRLIRLAVLDSGPGISPEMKARLFEPYFTSKARGNGLGLAIVKKIVEENHGKVVLANRHEVMADGSAGAIALVEFAKLENEADNPRVNTLASGRNPSSPNG